MSNLLALANQLKDGIAAKNTGIISTNKGLANKINAMNKTAEEILKKVRNFSTNSQTLQQNIKTQANEIAALKQQLEAAGKEQARKQDQITELQKQLAESQGQGKEVDVLKAQLAQLQQEATASQNKIQELTKELVDSSEEVRGLLSSLTSPEAVQSQEDLDRLINELEGHINDINGALPPPAQAIQGSRLNPNAPEFFPTKGGYVWNEKNTIKPKALSSKRKKYSNYSNKRYGTSKRGGKRRGHKITKRIERGGLPL